MEKIKFKTNYYKNKKRRTKIRKKRLKESIERNKKRIKFDRFLRLTMALNKETMHPWVYDKIKVKSMNLRKKIKQERLATSNFNDFSNY